MNSYSIIGENIPRTDGQIKATGAAVYADDIKLQGMLHGAPAVVPVGGVGWAAARRRLTSTDLGNGRRSVAGEPFAIRVRFASGRSGGLQEMAPRLESRPEHGTICWLPIWALP